MDAQKDPKWYFKTWPLVVSFLCVGPLMLPLVWANPRFSKNIKIIITVVVLALTFVLTDLLLKSMQNITGYYRLAF